MSLCYHLALLYLYGSLVWTIQPIKGYCILAVHKHQYLYFYLVWEKKEKCQSSNKDIHNPNSVDPP